jgi:hypothetical protein
MSLSPKFSYAKKREVWAMLKNSMPKKHEKKIDTKVFEYENNEYLDAHPKKEKIKPILSNKRHLSK